MKDLEIMKWHERMKTKIEIGKKYKTRDGLIVEVVDYQTNNIEIKYVVKDLSGKSWLKEYMVTEFGGFGIYPNHYDLVKTYNA